MDHFCPSRPGVTPGLQDLLCRLLGNWCPTKPRWEFPGIVPRTPGIPLDHSPGIIPGLEDHLPEVLLGILPTPVALLGETRPLGFYLPRDFSERPYLYHPVSKVCVCVTLLKDRIRRILLCFFQRTVYFPVSSREP